MSSNINFFIKNIYFTFTADINKTIMYLNVNKISKDMQKEGGNSYTYTKVSNLLSGFKGSSTKKEIQHLRKLIQGELSRVDKVLSKLENE